MFNSTPTWPSYYFHEDLAGDSIVTVGLRWLLDEVDRTGGLGTVVAPTRLHYTNHQSLVFAQRTFRCETARTLASAGVIDGPLLAVWPRDETLDLVEQWHRPSALCVVPWQLARIEKWRLARRPIDLLGHAEQAGAASIADPVVLAAMRDVSSFVNVNNELVQEEDKAAAVDALRRLVAGGHRLDPVELEVWALAEGWGATGAARLRDFAQRVIEGRSIRIRGFSWRDDALARWREEAEAHGDH